ncbi:hypothetical protein [Bibersteinia trehalosi]|nr:hypothetical protein [Bibersteinia trehalosi]
MDKKRIVLFLQNYFSYSVSYDDDDDCMAYLFSYIERNFNLNPQDTFQYSIDLFYRFMYAGLTRYVYWDLESEEDLKNDISKMVEDFNKFNNLDEWHNYFMPTKLIADIICEYDLIDGYYDENVISLEFEREISELLNKKGIGLDIYPLVDIGRGGIIKLK